MIVNAVPCFMFNFLISIVEPHSSISGSADAVPCKKLLASRASKAEPIVSINFHFTQKPHAPLYPPVYSLFYSTNPSILSHAEASAGRGASLPSLHSYGLTPVPVLCALASRAAVLASFHPLSWLI